MNLDDLNRRDFLRGITAGAFGLAMAMEEITVEAEPQTTEAPAPPVSCGVIGLGDRGREILASLAKMGPAAPIVGICDTYTAPGFLKRATDIAPNARVHTDYRALLADNSVKAVFIATPTHKHKQIVLDTLQAGRHVYCEAPLAGNIDEAKAIALAGKASMPKLVFQAGLQNRCNKQHVHVQSFMGGIGDVVGGRAQWHKKVDWRRPGVGPREQEINWRLDKAVSGGVLGEIGIHQLDTASWMLHGRPKSVMGFGGQMNQKWREDGREMYDTVQCVVEFPMGVRFLYDATLTNSFDGSCEIFMGTDIAVMIRDQRAWMYKESDAPLLGWEVYARKDVLKIGDAEYDTGIAMVADATKLIKQGKEPGKVGTDVSKTTLYQSISAFLDSVRLGKPVFLREPDKNNPNSRPPTPPGPLEGYIATMVALKANEAILTGNKITFEKEWFTL